MYEESVNEYHFDQFSESYSMPGMMDDLEIAQEQAPAELKKESRQFAVAGVISLLAGAAIYIGMNFGHLGLSALIENIAPFVILSGIGALGYGLIKGWRRIMRKARINFPKLRIRRKFMPYERQRTQQDQGPKWNQRLEQIVSNAQDSSRKAQRLARSSNRVFLGVAAGLAEHSRIPVSVIRLLFIGAFAISGGFAAILYVLLGIFLPDRKNLKSK